MDKLDTLGTQMTGVLVSLAGISGDVKAVLGRMDAYEGSKADHEARIRAVESIGLPGLVGRVAGLEMRVTQLEQWRWKIAGAAAVIGGTGGGIITWLTGQ